MLSSGKFINQSLELHLFSGRIMKEHSFFLQVGFTPKDSDFISQADAFRMEFDKFLIDVISISDGIVSEELLQSGEMVTPFTIAAEQASSYFTGIKIPTNITKAEQGLMGISMTKDKNISIEERVFNINNRAMKLIRNLIEFKSIVLSNVLSCKMFTINYPLMLHHILREAKLYFTLIQRIQRREEIDINKEMYEQETFWNDIMGEHAKFIKGLLDPTEDDLIEIANNFGNQFEQLTRDAKQAMADSMSIDEVTDESFKATAQISKFKAQGTQGLLECKIRSIIIPLLSDHVLREANHYLHLLKIFKREM